MADTLARVASLLLAAAFGWAALAKIVRFRGWRRALGRYGLSRVVEASGAYGVPAAEACVAALLVLGPMRVGGALSLVLICSFSLAVMRARSLRGDRLPCGCFGRASARDYREMLLRNALLGLLAAIVLVARSVGSSQVGMPGPGEWVPAVLVLVGVAAGGWTLWQATTSMRRGGHR